MTRRRGPRPSTGGIIWSLPAIAKRVGRGRDFAEAMMMLKGNPIKKLDGRYYVVEDELIEFMRGLGKQTG